MIHGPDSCQACSCSCVTSGGRAWAEGATPLLAATYQMELPALELHALGHPLPSKKCKNHKQLTFQCCQNQGDNVSTYHIIQYLIKG